MRPLALLVIFALAGCGWKHVQTIPPVKSYRPAWKLPYDAPANDPEAHWECPPGTWYGPSVHYSDRFNRDKPVTCTVLARKKAIT